MRKTVLHGYVYDFSVDYDAVDDILDIHKDLHSIICLFFFDNHQH